MTVEVHPTVENAMFDLDFYIPVATHKGYPVTAITACRHAWRTKDVRCYRTIGAARGVRTKAMNLRAEGRENVDLGPIRILHVHINLVDGTTESKWVE
jgi:hypothetical protein